MKSLLQLGARWTSAVLVLVTCSLPRWAGGGGATPACAQEPTAEVAIVVSPCEKVRPAELAPLFEQLAVALHPTQVEQVQAGQAAGPWQAIVTLDACTRERVSVAIQTPRTAPEEVEVVLRGLAPALRVRTLAVAIAELVRGRLSAAPGAETAAVEVASERSSRPEPDPSAPAVLPANGTRATPAGARAASSSAPSEAAARASPPAAVPSREPDPASRPTPTTPSSLELEHAPAPTAPRRADRQEGAEPEAPSAPRELAVGVGLEARSFFAAPMPALGPRVGVHIERLDFAISALPSIDRGDLGRVQALTLFGAAAYQIWRIRRAPDLALSLWGELGATLAEGVPRPGARGVRTSAMYAAAMLELALAGLALPRALGRIGLMGGYARGLIAKDDADRVLLTTHGPCASLSLSLAWRARL